MKTSIIFFLLVFMSLTASMASAQQQTPPPKMNADVVPPPPKPMEADASYESLEETKQYLTKNLAAYSGAVVQLEGKKGSLFYELVKFDGNILNLDVRIKKEAEGLARASNNAYYPTQVTVDSLSKVRFSLEDLNPKEVVVQKLRDGESFGVSVSTVNDKEKIFAQVLTNRQIEMYRPDDWGRYPNYSEGSNDQIKTASKFTFVLRDEERANRIARAMRHAIALAKNIPDPFQDPEPKRPPVK
jgi:hypothetical protein